MNYPEDTAADFDVFIWVLIGFVCVCFSVGEPITVPRMEDPSPEVVDMYHTMYITSLTSLFNNHKTRFGFTESDTLLIQWEPTNQEPGTQVDKQDSGTTGGRPGH